MEIGSVRGRIFRIQRFSIHDGYGIRTTVFLKGCPLRCVWCHNPESQRFEREVGYRREKCLRCYECLKVCELIEKAEKGIEIDREACDGCGRCVDVCRGGALEIYGEDVTVEEVVGEVEKDAVFYKNSNGGVTFSGGEPYFQPVFLKSLLIACEERGINAAVDTSGYARWDVIEDTLDLVDFFLYDVKDYRSDRHVKMCGVGNGVILENLAKLVASGCEVIVRIPVIPGYNFDLEQLGSEFDGYANILDNAGARRVDLLPYHSMARDKYRWLGRGFLSSDPDAAREVAREFADRLEEAGFDVTLGGYF